MGWEKITELKQPRATWMCLAEWCPILPTEVPNTSWRCASDIFSIGIEAWYWDLRHLSFLITESLVHSIFVVEIKARTLQNYSNRLYLT